MGKRIVHRIVLWAGWLLTVAAVALVLVGWAGAFMEHGFVGGLRQIREWLSPYNVSNWLVTVVALAPGLGLLALASKLEPKEPADVADQAS